MGRARGGCINTHRSIHTSSRLGSLIGREPAAEELVINCPLLEIRALGVEQPVAQFLDAAG